MERPRIPQPKTVLLHTRNVKIVGRELGFPCVLKQPDSQFSKGVIRVESETEFRRAANEMLERSDLIIAQSYEPTDYDWRIGVLDGQPLYACRYYMAKDHRSEEHTSELQSLMRNSYAVLCLKKKKKIKSDKKYTA